MNLPSEPDPTSDLDRAPSPSPPRRDLLILLGLVLLVAGLVALVIGSEFWERFFPSVDEGTP